MYLDLKDNFDKLIVHMLGKFSVIKDGVDITSQFQQAPNLTRLFCYLLMIQGAYVSSQKLVEKIIEERECIDPAHTIQNIVYRLRKLLDGDSKESCIITIGRNYAWNLKFGYSLDAILFGKAADDALESASNYMPDESKLRRAIKLYTDDFLTDMFDDYWVVTLRQGLKSKFLSCVEKLLELYEANGNNRGIIALCEVALHIDPYNELINEYYLDALMDEKKTVFAIQYYQQLTKRLSKELGVKPSRELEAAYNRLKNDSKEQVLDAKALISKMHSQEDLPGPYFCTYNDLVSRMRMDKHQMVCDKLSPYIIQFSFVQKDNEKATKKEIESAMDTLLKVLRVLLSCVDVVSVVEDERVVVYISNIQPDEVKILAAKIIKQFKEDNKQKTVHINYSQFQIK